MQPFFTIKLYQQSDSISKLFFTVKLYRQSVSIRQPFFTIKIYRQSVSISKPFFTSKLYRQSVSISKPFFTAKLYRQSVSIRQPFFTVKLCRQSVSIRLWATRVFITIINYGRIAKELASIALNKQTRNSVRTRLWHWQISVFASQCLALNVWHSVFGAQCLSLSVWHQEIEVSGHEIIFSFHALIFEWVWSLVWMAAQKLVFFSLLTNHFFS